MLEESLTINRMHKLDVAYLYPLFSHNDNPRSLTYIYAPPQQPANCARASMQSKVTSDVKLKLPPMPSAMLLPSKYNLLSVIKDSKFIKLANINNYRGRNQRDVEESENKFYKILGPAASCAYVILTFGMVECAIPLSKLDATSRQSHAHQSKTRVRTMKNTNSSSSSSSSIDIDIDESQTEKRTVLVMERGIGSLRQVLETRQYFASDYSLNVNNGGALCSIVICLADEKTR
jgi:hypothetical protein